MCAESNGVLEQLPLVLSPTAYLEPTALSTAPLGSL